MLPISAPPRNSSFSDSSLKGDSSTASGRLPNEVIAKILEHLGPAPGQQFNVQCSKRFFELLRLFNFCTTERVFPQKFRDHNSAFFSVFESALVGKEELSKLKQLSPELTIPRYSDSALNGLQGYSPLLLLILFGQIEAINNLLKAGADANAKCYIPFPSDLTGTALYFAVREQNVEAVALLLQNEARVNESTLIQASPLHWAVKSQNLVITQLLLRRSADPQLKDKNGRTPLHALVEAVPSDQTIKLISSLLDNSEVEVNATDGQGRTPLDLLIQSIAALRAGGAGESREHRVKVALFLIERGAQFNAEFFNQNDEQGQGLIHTLVESLFDAAPSNQTIALIESLLDNSKVEVNARDGRGRTPLDLFLDGRAGLHQDEQGRLAGIESILRQRGASQSEPMQSDLPDGDRFTFGNLYQVLMTALFG